MHISELHISGYRAFSNNCTVKLNKGITVLLGENGSGKSSVIDALRLLFLEDDYGRTGAKKTDFHRAIGKSARDPGVSQFNIDCQFSELDATQQVTFLPWLDPSNVQNASLHLLVQNETGPRGRLKRDIWGGSSQASVFEFELLQNATDCIYLPPLRNAEEELRSNRGSRLARLVKNLRPAAVAGTPDPLEVMVEKHNLELENDVTIQKANDYIKKSLIGALGSLLGQDTLVQFSEVSFDRIVERLCLLFYPLIPSNGKPTERMLFRELGENSLGYNNLLYLATILAELEAAQSSQLQYRLLLIEEPEAHLHPQLQTRVLQFLSQLAGRDGLQVVVTTHSPTIAAAVNLSSISVMALSKVGDCPQCISLSDCGLSTESQSFLRRWLDVTKSTLLFARGVILVEGIAEALVIPELAKLVIKEIADKAKPGDTSAPQSLQDLGVSVINLGGIFFRHFMPLFRGEREMMKGGAMTTEACSRLPIRCAGLTDRDPGKNPDDTPATPQPGEKPTSTNYDEYLVGQLEKNEICRLFMNCKTFEYDLAIEGNNLSVVCAILAEITTTDGPIKKTALGNSKIDWKAKTPAERAQAAQWFLDHVESQKGLFAQKLAEKLASGTVIDVPDYIRKAIQWVIPVK
jgi:predicted ATP-dependent endonuclease of OLD family